MREPEFSGNRANQENDLETSREINQTRGEETNRAAMLAEEQELQVELLRKQAELEEKLRALGVDPEPIIEKARADYLAKKKSSPVASRKVEAAPAPKVEEAPKAETKEAPKEAPKTEEVAKDVEIAEPEELEESEEIEEVEELEEVSPAELAKKIKNSAGLRKVFTRVALAAGALITAAGVIGGAYFASKTQPAPKGNQITYEEEKAARDEGRQRTGESASTLAQAIDDYDAYKQARDEGRQKTNEYTAEANKQFAGETINGVEYDYTEYADRENKVSKNAYGYDYSDCYDRRDDTTEGIMHMASQAPEALASYAYNILTDEEKKELGIDGLTMVQIDNKFDQEGGGELQEKLLNKLEEILNDIDNTYYNFYYENDKEQTNYIYFVDENGDGIYTPEELQIGYDTKKRNNAPQVDIYRTIVQKDGTAKGVKMLDLNMRCGFQPNYEVAPTGVKKVSSNKTTIKKTNPASTPTPGGTTISNPTPSGEDSNPKPSGDDSDPKPSGDDDKDPKPSGDDKDPKPSGDDDKDPNPNPDPVKPEPEPEPEPEPDKPHDEKDEDEERKHAGDATPRGLDEDETPKTDLSDDQANFAADEAQRQQEEAARKAAEQAAQEQAQREQAAREEAARRQQEEASAEQQRQAEEAARKAQEEAAAEQQRRAEEEARAAAEQAAREQAQREANERASAESTASEANSNETAEQRANDFANGNF